MPFDCSSPIRVSGAGHATTLLSTSVDSSYACRRVASFPVPASSTHQSRPAALLASSLKVRSASESHRLHLIAANNDTTLAPAAPSPAGRFENLLRDYELLRLRSFHHNNGYSRVTKARDTPSPVTEIPLPRSGHTDGTDALMTISPTPSKPVHVVTTDDLKRQLASLMISATPPLTPNNFLIPQNNNNNNYSAPCSSSVVVGACPSTMVVQAQPVSSTFHTPDNSVVRPVVPKTTASFTETIEQNEQQVVTSQPAMFGTPLKAKLGMAATTDDCPGTPPYVTLPRAKSSHFMCKSEYRPSHGRKKISFADDHGLDLCSVRVMNENSDEPPKFSHQLLVSLLGEAAAEQHHRPVANWMLDFTQPASDYMAFRQVFERQSVALENVLVRNEHSRVSGTIRVRNAAFEKIVFVRYTIDNWASFYDRAATHQSGNDLFDTFVFEIDLPVDDDRHRRVEFCVCFRAPGLGDEFWDNNGGKNYRLISAALKNELDERKHSEQWYARDKQDVHRSPPTHDAFRADYENWAEFSSWKNLSTEGPYW